jgi:hypothetical protein
VTTLAAPEDISALDDFSFDCDWGEVIQPDIDGCDNEPVWGVECPGCKDSWCYSCDHHHDMTFDLDNVWQCLMCKSEWEAHELNWFKLP